MIMQRRFAAIPLLVLPLLLYLSCTPGMSLTRKSDNRNSGRYISDDRYAANSDNTDRDSYRDGDHEDNYNFDRSDRDNRADETSRVSRDDVSDFPSDSADDSQDRSYRKEHYFQTGIASWYGREFHGKRTASGERFDMYQLTAAHRTLPLGSIVEVTNLKNRRKVRVRINDRGPYRGKRIIDLSYRAAQRLGIVKIGQELVGIRVLKKGDDQYASEDEHWYQSGKKNVEPVSDDDSLEGDRDTRGLDAHDGNYAIQAGAFYSRRNAEGLKTRLEDLTGGRVSIVHENDLYKVRIVDIYSSSKAGEFKRLLSRENIPSYTIQKHN